MEKFGIGQAVRRLEDERFLKGEGQYIDDFTYDRQLHGVVVRSPHAHARIVEIDTADAAAAPGVVRILTVDDCHAEGLGAIPSMTTVDGLVDGTLNHPPHHPLADGVAKYVGDPVAYVIAETRAQALDAAEQVWVDYEPLPEITELARVFDDGAPLVWPGHETNRAFRFVKGDKDAVDQVFAEAAHVVSLDLVNNRLAPMSVEPRGVIGDHDAETGRYTLHVSGQAVHGQRNQMAAAVFKVEPEQIRVVAADVGGGFGAKNFVYPENILVMLGAKLTGRPVKWIAERSELFLSEIHGRDHVTTAQLALDADGRFIGLRVDTIANMGAYLSTFAPIIPTSASWVSMGGNYDIPSVYMEVNAAFTNTVPVDAYRGAGRPESAYIIERLADIAAFELGRDPADLRRQNFIGTFPYVSSLGMTLDCGDFAGSLDMASDAAGLSTFAARKAEAAGRARLRGVGLSSYLEVTLGMPNDGAEIRFENDGRATLLVGTQSTGQGHQTAYAQIVNDVLGIAPENITYVHGDTDLIKAGGGHGGSRSLMIGGSAVVRSAEAVREKGRAAAAHILDADIGEIDFGDGLYAVRGTNRRITLAELERAVRDAPDLPDGMERTLGASGTFERTAFSYPNGCHIAEVEVDPETGRFELCAYPVVDDFGRIVNPLIAEGQVQGGAVQGIGQAYLENIVYEPETGQLLTGSLMDYAMPRADDLPAIEVSFNQNAPTETNPLGVKGAGEAGATGSPAAIVNAVLDALKDHGVRHLDMPLNAEKVWRALRQAQN
ncbi:MAG: xanthine dehydrogenase family protein molybdopterin-binding subunit [Hyphomicrobiales bacterium]